MHEEKHNNRHFFFTHKYIAHKNLLINS
ncbi:unnamed protein product [Larinioides sclopetarius]|uniref:Uncharacterized protein n=1 Tax=Larinioides sclopetarius TaxID=280406 RepID=A0AAV2BMD0_9ARAC